MFLETSQFMYSSLLSLIILTSQATNFPRPELIGPIPPFLSAATGHLIAQTRGPDGPSQSTHSRPVAQDNELHTFFSNFADELVGRRSNAPRRAKTLAVERLEDRHLMSVTQITSAFGPRTAAGQAAAESNWLDTDPAFQATEKLDSETLAYGFWTYEDRPVDSWQNFRTTVARLQSENPQMKVLAYLGSPLYAVDETFHWVDRLPGDASDEVGRYDDYHRWAREVALLSIEFPIVKGILIDDFNADMSRDAGINKVFTPEYVESFRATGRSIAPDFRVESIEYLPAISAYDAKRFENALDAVHFVYRHFLETADRIDPNPDRIGIEIDMFRRAFSANELSPLATVYHPSTAKARKGDVVSVQATIDLNSLHSDLIIAHFDTIAPSAGSTGWVQKRILFDGNVVYDADLAADSLDVQTVTIPASQLQALRASGKTTAEVKLELVVSQGFNRWSYSANIFIRQPDDVPVAWAWTDATKSNIVVTGNDLVTPSDRYIGLYGISPSFMTITPEYSRTILDYARAAYEAGDLEGISVWEIASPVAQPEIFDVYQDYFEAVSLDRRFQLFVSGGLQQNWGGQQERWLLSKARIWYYILPNGQVYEWTGGKLNGKLVAELNPIYYAEPERIYNAVPPPNLAPLVNAGADQSIQLPALATLTGTASDDKRPSSTGRLTYQWTKTAGPGTVTFSSPAALSTTTQFSTAGTYTLRLLVGDGQLSAFDELTIVVATAPLPAPTPPTKSFRRRR